MRAKLLAEAPLRPLKEREHVDLIMDYLKIFHEEYERLFGLMEDCRPHSSAAGGGGVIADSPDGGNNNGSLGVIKDNTVYIRSTGYGAKVFLGLLMADRLHVVERTRKEERERLAYETVDISELPEDGKYCPVCQDLLGVQTPEGTIEAPIKLLICCGQVIGETCLKSWLGEWVNDQQKNSCPCCRFQFPKSFLEKLFKDEDGSVTEDGGLNNKQEYEDVIVVDSPPHDGPNEQRGSNNLISPSPTPPPAS